MLNFTIRELKKEDYYNNFLEILEELTIVGDITYNDFCKKFDELNSQVYVIIDNLTKNIVGSGTILIENKFIHNLSSVAHIEDIVISKNYRNLGLGKYLINFLIDIAKKESSYKIILDCDDKNVEFYEKCGFSKKGNQMAIYIL